MRDQATTRSRHRRSARTGKVKVRIHQAHLDLSGHKNLRNLENLRPLTSLVSLVLYGCKALQNLDGLREMHSLRYVDIQGCTSLEGLQPLLTLNLDAVRMDDIVESFGVFMDIRSLEKRGTEILYGPEPDIVES